jgi:K+-transporting ATPase ATPase C chain
MLEQVRPAIVLILILSIVTGLLYPMAITGVAQAAFPKQANGSRIQRDGVLIGSELIGQGFSQPRYFWPRPSATGPGPYNAAASTGSNIGPTGKALVDRVAASVQTFGQETVPADAVTASGSGLDPHISPQFARSQIARVAGARQVEPGSIEALLAEMTEQPSLGIFGEPRVNVLRLNLALDVAAPIENEDGPLE